MDSLITITINRIRTEHEGFERAFQLFVMWEVLVVYHQLILGIGNGLCRYGKPNI